MLDHLKSIIAFLVVARASSPACPDGYSDTIAILKNAGKTSKFYKTAYRYAVCPTIAKGAFIVGGAQGDGRVSAKGEPRRQRLSDQATVGLQVGGVGYSENRLLQDEHAFREIASGGF